MTRLEVRRIWLRGHSEWFGAVLIASPFAVLLGVMLTTPGMRKAVGLLALVPWVALLLNKDVKRMSEGRPPMGLLGLVLVVPLAHLAFASFATQAVFLAVVACYLFVLKPAERIAAIRRVRPILPFLLAFVLLVAFSYFFSMVDASPAPWVVLNDDPFFIWSFLLGTAFALLPGVVCRSIQALGWMVRALFAVALLQGVVVSLQLVGIADRLPGSWAQINASQSAKIVGTVLSADALRYVGTFGDYELLAEFSSIVFIIALGVAVFRLLPSGQVVATITAIVACGTGLLTGTRSAVVSMALGVLVLLVSGLVLQRGRKLRWVLRAGVVAVVSISVLYFAVPGSSLQAYYTRLMSSRISGFGAQTFNRGLFYSTGFAAAKDMPPLGYGMRMMAEFDSHLPAGGVVRSPHSLYLDALLIAGVPGLIALAALVLRLLQLTWRMTFSRHSATFNRWGSVLLAATVIWAMTEMKVDFIRFPFYIDMTFLLLGLIAAAYSLGREDHREANGAGAAARADSGRET